MTSRILVCGGRDYSDAQKVLEVLSELKGVTIVHGAARGADSIAANIAHRLGLEVEAHPADWLRYGKSAGAIRNQEMLDSGVQMVIAFPGGWGTADMVRRARMAKVPVTEIPY